MREHHFTPGEIDVLFFDKVDHHGIGFIFQDILDVNFEIEKTRKTKK